MIIRKLTQNDKNEVLALLDEFREDCILQITGEKGFSESAVNDGAKIFNQLVDRSDYRIFVSTDDDNKIVGIITGYFCPMLRNGSYRAEVEEFYVKPEYRGHNVASKLMDAFFEWCKDNNVMKVYLESDNSLLRAHSFYKKYGFESKAQRFVKSIT